MKRFLFFLIVTTSLVWAAPPKDIYADFKEVPDYIKSPSEGEEAYYKAYDKTMALWGVPYEDLYVPTSHGIAHVIRSGDLAAEAVVLFHGLSSSSTMWYTSAQALTENHQIFAIDLIVEPGKSRLTKKFRNIKEITDWYQEVINKLQLDSYHLIGPSRGGWFALDLALKYPERIDSVILISPVQAIIWIPPSKALLKNVMNIFYTGRKRIARTMSTLSNDTDELDPLFLEQYRLGKARDTKRKFITAMQPFKKKQLSRVKVPVYMLVGEQDIFNNQRSLDRFKKYVPNSAGELIKDSAHFLPVDQTETVNEKMLSFLKQHPSCLDKPIQN